MWTEVAPELERGERDTVTLNVQIVREVVNAVGRKEWGDRLFTMNDSVEISKAIKKLLLEGKEIPIAVGENLRPWVSNNRKVTIHGETVEEGHSSHLRHTRVRSGHFSHAFW